MATTKMHTFYPTQSKTCLPQEVEAVTTSDGQHPIDITTEKRITRKLDLHIIPWLFFMWFFGSLDRANIGNASIAGLSKDLKLENVQFNVALLIFYIPYVVIDIPSNLVIKHFQAGYYLPALIIVWGLTCTCMGFVKSYGGLIAGRAILGMCEGGLIGGILIYLALFYRRQQLLTRVGLFASAAPLAIAFGGLLATGLSKISCGGYNGWPWIFFVEGAITVAYGILTLFFLPHTPAQAKFFNAQDRDVAVRRMKEDADGAMAADEAGDEHFKWHWVRMALKSPNTIICSLGWFFLLISIYSYALFLPTIIHELGYSAVHAQLLTVPPNICGFVAILVLSTWSDKVKARGPFIVGGCILAIAGYIMLLAAESPAVKYGGTFLIATGVYPGTPIVQGWLANNLAPHYVRATGIGFQVTVANCAAFIATFAYLSKDA
ncbi:hypothetical protein AYO22_11203 [Fonsecaea multimorphosa]|nr:hypothetical protein AYO22_11203 [Fonsecaea multimorphosa]